MNAETTGYAYDLKRAGQILAHIEELTGINMLDYSHAQPTTEKTLANVTSPNWVFVAIGFRAHAGNVGFPVLAHNIETDAWVWSRNLVWYEKEHGFVWDGGNYTSKEKARAKFQNECDGGLLYLIESEYHN